MALTLPQCVNVTHGNFEILPRKVKEFALKWIDKCKPDRLHIVDGTWDEEEKLVEKLMEKGIAHKLDAYDNWYE